MTKMQSGKYTASAKGLENDVDVEVTIQDEKITDIDIDLNDTSRVGNNAAKKIKDNILKSQSTDVDVVSGASVTSNAIKQAVQDALDEASGKKHNDDFSINEGFYTGSAQGRGGKLTLRVKALDDRIGKVEVVSHNETPSLGDQAIGTVINEVVDGQTLNVDTVTGATLTSRAAISAITNAVENSGADLKSWQNKPSQAKVPINNSITTDVVVVGGGIAGLNAAASAASRGKKVVLVEKNGFLGGNFLISDQAITMATIDSTYKDYQEAMSYLKRYGINLDIAVNELPGYGKLANATLPNVQGINSLAITIIDKLKKVIIQNNGQIILESPVKNLITDNNKVVGAIVAPKHGNEFEIRAKSVVITTGGYSANPTFVKKYLPWAAGAFSVGLQGNTGDALSWGENLNLKKNKMNVEDSSFYSVDDKTDYYAEKSATINYFVDKTGKLLTDIHDYNAGTEAVYKKIDREKYYVLASEKNAKQMGILNEFADTLNAGTIKRFKSLKEIAEKYNMPNLLETMKDADDGAYFIGFATAGIYGTYGGLVTDEDYRAVDKNNKVVPGLYIAGETLGSPNYQENGYYAGGVGLGFVSGYVAGKTASEDI